MECQPWTREQIIRMDLRAQARMARIHGHMMRPELRRRLAKAINPQCVAVASLRITYRWDWDRLVYGVPKIVPALTPVGRGIILQVCRKHGINYKTIVGPRGQRSTTTARQEAMYRLSTELGLSTPQIGRMLGGRDHSTVVHGLKKHRERNGLPVYRHEIRG